MRPSLEPNGISRLVRDIPALEQRKVTESSRVYEREFPVIKKLAAWAPSLTAWSGDFAAGGWRRSGQWPSMSTACSVTAGYWWGPGGEEVEALLLRRHHGSFSGAPRRPDPSPDLRRE